MRISTILATLVVVCAGMPAAAQTELNSRPTAPAAMPPAPGVRANPPALPAARPASLSRYRTSALGLDLGWGGPYGGLGMNYAHMLGPGTDINVGVGVGVGGKIGVGVRYFLSPANAISPYFGINLARSGRIDEITTTLDAGQPSEETVTYSIAPSGVLHLRSGLRWQPGRVGLLGTLGYGVRLSGDPVSYTTNGVPPSRRMRDIVNIISPGGLELSLGMSIGLGR